DVGLDLIGDLHVVEVLEADTALETFAHFRHVVLETAQRGDAPFPRHDAVANETRARVPPDRAIDDHATGNCADARHPEDFADFGFAQNLLFLDLLEHADHRGLNF